MPSTAPLGGGTELVPQGAAQVVGLGVVDLELAQPGERVDPLLGAPRGGVPAVVGHDHVEDTVDLGLVRIGEDVLLAGVSGGVLHGPLDQVDHGTSRALVTGHRLRRRLGDDELDDLVPQRLHRRAGGHHERRRFLEALPPPSSDRSLHEAPFRERR